MSVVFLRNKNNDSVVDIDIWTKEAVKGRPFTELRAVVDIRLYSEVLLNNLDRSEDIIADFQEISELRGWLWEKRLHPNNDGTKTDEIRREVEDMLEVIGRKYSLAVVVD